MPDQTKPQVPTALDELCRAYGVASAYHDIWGKVHRASDATRRAILKALGALGEGQDLQAALRERELRSWSTITPPVAVFRVDAAPYRMRFRFDQQHEHATYRWRFELENGELRTGDIQAGPARDSAPARGRTTRMDRGRVRLE